MNLRVNGDRKLLYPVAVDLLKNDGSGETSTFEFKALFRLLTGDELVALPKMSVDEAEKLFRDRIVGWEGIEDANGNPLPYSGESLKAVLAIPAIERALAGALYKASQDVPAKNSSTGSAG